MTPTMQITWAVLEAAKDTGDELTVSMCRQCIIANRLGWKRHNGHAVFTKFVAPFYDAMDRDTQLHQSSLTFPPRGF